MNRKIFSRDMKRISLKVKLALIEHKFQETPSLNIKDQKICDECREKPCGYVCPMITRLEKDEEYLFSLERCLECGACRIACMYDNIEWKYPDGGFGVIFRYG